MIYDQIFFTKALNNPEFITYGISLEQFFAKNNISSFDIDSRTVNKNEIFIALCGQKVDGHNFIEEVLQKDISGLIININKKYILDKINENLLKDKLIILVPDSLQALKDLAQYWRAQFNFPIIGITGSVGKTTTKNILHHIFTQAGILSFASHKNQNTIIGICLNILKLRDFHKFGIFEMGISHIGEMEELANYLRPDIGVITYISPAHTQGLENIKIILQEKLKIFSYFKQNNIAIVYGDKEIIKNSCNNFPVITFGKKTSNNIQARKIKLIEIKDKLNQTTNLHTRFILKIYNQKYPVLLPVFHDGLLNNSLAAAAIATHLKIDQYFIIRGIESYSSTEGRFEKIKLKNNLGLIINDCYNASPESMKAAIKAFSLIKSTGQKIAVLGDMLELGKTEKTWHKNLGKFLQKFNNINKLILVGNNAQLIAQTAPTDIVKYNAQNWQEAQALLNNILNNNNNLILLKASHSMGLENIVNGLK
ncbi:MAG: UDP-N-acetylmuramoyl-tripeptide-D-alanyl-D-alanine ligase [candidate division TM6 bacterium GW2011_GWF2_28_16]|nr:MAG: UDP-N-acetylmuramoyl-tripeptide-D-alanyl-D-alanine ligase [candidate division TM6 bacterium GW2011_GWF2_28_16]